MIYVEIVNNKLTRSTPFEDVAKIKFGDYIITNFEDYSPSNNKYIYDEKEKQIILNPNYEAMKKQEERARLDNLSLTRGDVFEAFILAKGLGKTQIRAMIEALELDEITKALYLNRFDEASNFYRGYPIFNILGAELNITPEMLDEFFETNDYTALLPVEEENGKLPKIIEENVTSDEKLPM